MSEIRPGTWWRQRNGGMYHVLFIANENDDVYPKTVVYQGEDGKTWALHYDDWHRCMRLSVGFVPSTVLSQEVQDLTMSPVFRRQYFVIAEAIYNLKTGVPQLSTLGATIRLPGGRLEIF